MLLSIAGPGLLLRSSAQARTFDSPDLERYREAWSQEGALSGMLAWYRAAFRDLGNTFTTGRIRMPALVLWGDRDIALDKRGAELSLRYCTKGQVVHYPEASHWLQHDEPEAVNRELLNFFRSGG